MQEVGGHADWHSSWDHPLLELERQFWRNPRTAVHGTVAATITNVSQPFPYDDFAMRDTRKEYRRPSLIKACK